MSATEALLKEAFCGAQQAQQAQELPTRQPSGLVDYLLIRLGKALRQRDDAELHCNWAQQSYESLLVRQGEMRERIDALLRENTELSDQLLAQAATMGAMNRRIAELAPQKQFEVMGVYNVRDKRGLRDCMRELPQLGVESVNGKTRIRVGLRACDRKRAD